MTTPHSLGRAPTLRVLLDTAFCLTLIRTRAAAMQTLFHAYTPGEIALSSMTVAALQARAERSRDPARNRRALEQFLLPLVVVNFDATDARILGRIAGWWPNSGDPAITQAQLLAAQAIQLGAELVTSRPDLYAPVPELRINTTFAEDVPAGAPASTQETAGGPALSRTSGTIIAVGSHDMTLDLLGDSLHAAHPELTLVSAHVGSLHGLLALQRGEAHLAGSHLLDSASGDYNVTHVRNLLTAHGIRVMLIGFVRRIQGLIVAAGNPKGLMDFTDLVRPDVRFVNRQPGSGTRVLLDYELARRGLDSNAIHGYSQAESSHMTVAMAVASGAADCGLGIQAAAQAQGLDFVALTSERYDLVIPVQHYEGPLLAPLLTLLRHPSSDFLARVAALGGYDVAEMGHVLAEL